MIDGVVEGATAFLKKPYCAEELGEGYNAKPDWTLSELTDSFRQLNENGFQTHSHCIGDAATDICLTALERANIALIKGNRNVLTHLQVVDKPDIKRMAKQGLIACLQPFWFLKEPGWFYEVDVHYLGNDRANNIYPAKTFLKNGIPITASGDYPVSPSNDPFFGIQAAVTRNIYSEELFGVRINSPDDNRYLLGKNERLTIKEIIEAYTINGARQLFREDEIGSLAAGKEADFIIIDKDPFIQRAIDLNKIKVIATYMSGKNVLEKRRKM